jgi:hypothetical protein
MLRVTAGLFVDPIGMRKTIDAADARQNMRQKLLRRHKQKISSAGMGIILRMGFLRRHQQYRFIFAAFTS